MDSVIEIPAIAACIIQFLDYDNLQSLKLAFNHSEAVRDTIDFHVYVIQEEVKTIINKYIQTKEDYFILYLCDHLNHNWSFIRNSANILHDAIFILQWNLSRKKALNRSVKEIHTCNRLYLTLRKTR